MIFTNDLVEQAAEILGFDPSDENVRDQLSVFCQCLGTMVERQESYGPDSWNKRGWRSNVVYSGAKWDRIEAKFYPPSDLHEQSDDPLDDAFDMINYLGFFIRGYEERDDEV